MRTINVSLVRDRITRLICDSLVSPDEAVTRALENIATDSDVERTAARLIAENNRIAKSKRLYACQDTGQAVLFVKLGDEVSCPGLYDALQEAVRDAYKNARKSVADPITRANTGDNTPAITETELTRGDTLEVTFLAKGAGSENMSRLYMLTPADGEGGIIRSVLNAVELGGRNACPPLIVGVGIGGVTETACMLSKRALLRKVGDPSMRADVSRLENVLLDKINKTGIGVGALGGRLTALAVNIETAPTHIGMLPVAVNLSCHSLRHATAVF